MSTKIEDVPFSLDNWFNGNIKPGSDLGPTDSNREGAYRRGYHQAIAGVLSVLENGGKVTAESLSTWVEEDGMSWRKDVTLERMILPPSLPRD